MSGVIHGKEYRPPLHLGAVAIEKGAFGSPSNKLGQLTWRNSRFGKSDKMRKTSGKVDKPKH